MSKITTKETKLKQNQWSQNYWKIKYELILSFVGPLISFTKVKFVTVDKKFDPLATNVWVYNLNSLELIKRVVFNKILTPIWC